MRLFVVALALFVVATVAHVLWYLRPVGALRMQRSTVLMERRAYYSLSSNGKDVFYFSGVSADSLFVGISTDSDSAMTVDCSAGFWINRWALFPSCLGRLVTSFVPIDSVTVASTTLLANQREYCSNEIKRLSAVGRELKYYLRSHSASDEGFNRVATYNENVLDDLRRLRMLYELIDSVTSHGGDFIINKHERFTAFYHGLFRHSKSVDCNVLVSSDSLLLLRTHNGITPIGALAVSPSLFASADVGDSLVCVGFGALSMFERADTTARYAVVPGTFGGGKVSVPIFLTGRGSPVYTKKGLLLGVNRGDRLVRRDDISSLFAEKGGWR